MSLLPSVTENQQRSGIVVHIQLQQCDNEPITSALIVVGIEPYQLAIVVQRFVIAAEALQRLREPEPGPHVRPHVEVPPELAGSLGQLLVPALPLGLPDTLTRSNLRSRVSDAALTEAGVLGEHA